MEKLIRQCQQGDRESMGQLYLAMRDELLGQCRQYVADNTTAEDLLHDAFLLIFSNIGKLRSPEKGRQWMYRIVRNTCLLYAQHRQHLAQVPVEVLETVPSKESDPAVSYDDILNAINQLPNGYQQVFRLSVLEGLTHQQIAELLGIEPHTSSSQLLRAKRQLRNLLQVLILVFLAAIPLGVYYYWAAQNEKHPVAELPKETPKDTTINRTSPVGVTTASMQKRAESHRADVKKKAIQHVVEEKDVVAIVTDSAEKKMVHLPEKQDTIRQKTPLPERQMVLPSKSVSHSSFQLSLAYGGLPNGTVRQLPYGDEGTNGDIVDSVAHHRMPMTIALNARYNLNRDWWVDGGLRYTLLSSEMRMGNTGLYMEQQQRVRYLGISLGLGRQLWNSRHWSLYGTTSVSLELPLRSNKETFYWSGSQLINKENNRLSPHTQWSVGAGLGLQYNLTPSVGLFAEPSLHYYFPTSEEISTWRTKHPFTPMLPFGVRVSF